MNAASNPADDFIHHNPGGFDSDSDAETIEDTPEYYQPISASPDDDEDSDSDSPNRQYLNPDGSHHLLPNGYAIQPVVNGVSSLDLSEEDGGDIEESEEEEGIRLEAEAAARRAFRDDDSRRNAPLPPENATRVMEAMRGVSFIGMAPDWAGRVPDDQWMDRVRRIRQPAATSTVRE